MQISVPAQCRLISGGGLSGPERAADCFQPAGTGSTACLQCLLTWYACGTAVTKPIQARKSEIPCAKRRDHAGTEKNGDPFAPLGKLGTQRRNCWRHMAGLSHLHADMRSKMLLRAPRALIKCIWRSILKSFKAAG